MPFDTTDETRSFWNEFAPAYNAEPGRITPGLMEPLLALSEGGRRTGRVLDLACGAGRTTGTLARIRGSAEGLVGVDLSEVMVEQARVEHPEITFTSADAARLPFDGSSFDLVTCNLALMLFPEPRKALAELRRVLAPGGELLASVWGRPEHTTIMTLGAAVARELGIEISQPARSNFHLGTPQAMRETLAGSGLELHRHDYYALRFEFEGPDHALDVLGMNPDKPGRFLKAMAEEHWERFATAARTEAAERLDAGEGALVMDVLLAAIG